MWGVSKSCFFDLIKSSIFDRFWTHLGALLGRPGSHVAPKWPTQTFKQCHFRVFDPSEILSNFNEILTSLGNGPKSKKRLKCDRGARFWPPWNGKMAPRGPPLDFEGARKKRSKINFNLKSKNFERQKSIRDVMKRAFEIRSKKRRKKKTCLSKWTGSAFN